MFKLTTILYAWCKFDSNLNLQKIAEIQIATQVYVSGMFLC